ncbi:MAG: TlpA family protein disulfide reductase [Christensenellales bacterium]|jgi:thiol-disulfide isomerase/thioredoxin
MKKMAVVIIFMLTLGILSACSNDTGKETQKADSVPIELNQKMEKPSPATNDMQYAFEFKDIDGNTHKLSDYGGRPVYLEVWASWCGVCTSSLPELDALTVKAQDFAVLSVVMPSARGEKDKEDFISWYKSLGYKNLVVLFDEQSQIVNDFGISAYPTQIMFDSKGNVVTGIVGLLSTDNIIETMQSIAAGTYK